MLPIDSLKHRAKNVKVFAAIFLCTCENIKGELLTRADERIKHKVVLFYFSVVGHNKRQPSIHTGVPYEMSLLHAVGTNELTLSICDLVEECAPK